MLGGFHDRNLHIHDSVHDSTKYLNIPIYQDKFFRNLHDISHINITLLVKRIEKKLNSTKHQNEKKKKHIPTVPCFANCIYRLDRHPPQLQCYFEHRPWFVLPGDTFCLPRKIFSLNLILMHADFDVLSQIPLPQLLQLITTITTYQLYWNMVT